MKKSILTSCLVFAMVLLSSLALSLPAFAANAGSQQAPAARSARAFKNACAQARKGRASCLALVSTTTVLKPNGKALGAHPNASSPGGSAPYSPANLAAAYNLPTNAGTSQTVAIVDAQDDPNAEADMNTYRSQFGLPACTSSSGCFSKVDQNGGTNYPAADGGWAEEISLDLDMVSAICNNCHILLVEANSASFSDLGQAENTAASLGANEISNSYGGGESSGDSSTCNSYYNHSGVVITASSGDGGLGVESPADCGNVVGVGGTTLNSDGSETAWSSAGGGCSSYIGEPSWENSGVTNCGNRAVSDVSADADPNTGVYVYDTYQQGGWLQVGGTSASSPIIASVYALAGGGSNDAASIPWGRYTSGCLNQVGGQTYQYQAGLGSPNGTGCF
ncbi:MAG TPA: peptidase S8 [Ktedonobacteraceae bacterium]|nr:peptidase S8 [Ktedonobacteraceae bacterium]